MNLCNRIIFAMGVAIALCGAINAAAQTTQPTGDEQPQLSPAEQTAAIKDLAAKYDNAADFQRAVDQRTLTELASKLRLTAAQEQQIGPDYIELDHHRGGLFVLSPLPKLLENGSRDSEFPKQSIPGDDTDDKVFWAALVSMVEALDDPATPNDVLRSRITTMHEATAKTQADLRAKQERVIAALNGRQVALLQGTVLLIREAHQVKLRPYSVTVIPSLSSFGQFRYSEADPYGQVHPEVHTGIQGDLNLKDDEYEVLKPKIDAVLLSRARTDQPLAFFNNIRSKRRRLADLANQNYDGVAGVMVNLDVALRDPDTPDDVFVAEENDLAAAVRDAHKDFIKAEGELRSLLTPRQEAILMVEGVLE